MKRFIFSLALLPLLVVSGCMTRAVREKQAQICSNLATLNSAIAVLRGISNSTTVGVGALKQAEDQVSVAFRNVKAAVAGGQETTIDDLEKTYDDLHQAVQDIPDQSTTTQAIASTTKASITDKVITMEAASLRMKSGLRCP
jgi:outer membrane murein-binding lipoprotein Lpp